MISHYDQNTIEQTMLEMFPRSSERIQDVPYVVEPSKC